MRAWIARMTEDNIDQSAIEKAGEILKNGGLAAFPTETVYGLGGNALDAKASEKIYAAKGRPSDNPLIVHIGRMEDLETVAANVPESARKLAAACWPGPLTMIFEKTNAVPLETTGGLTSVAVRYPSNKVANALILAGGGFIAAPSANTSGRPSPTKAEHVIEDLGDKIDCIIDGGDAEIGLESTIVDFTEEIPTILRPGYYNKEMLEKVNRACRSGNPCGGQPCASEGTGHALQTLCAEGRPYDYPGRDGTGDSGNQPPCRRTGKGRKESGRNLHR